jgi:hypothetical protein
MSSRKLAWNFDDGNDHVIQDHKEVHAIDASIPLQAAHESYTAPNPQPAHEPPIKHKINILPIVLLLFYMAASAYYFYTRVVTLTSSYGLFVLIAELLGFSSTLPLAILLTR